MNNLGVRLLAAEAVYLGKPSLCKILQSFCCSWLLFTAIMYLYMYWNKDISVNKMYIILLPIIIFISITTVTWLEECKWSLISKTKLPTAWHKWNRNWQHIKIASALYLQTIYRKSQATLASYIYTNPAHSSGNLEKHCSLVNIEQSTHTLRLQVPGPLIALTQMLQRSLVMC